MASLNKKLGRRQPNTTKHATEEHRWNRNDEGTKTMDHGLWKIHEAAAWLQVSESLLWKLVKDRTIPVVRIGRTVRFDPADLATWIGQRKLTAAPAPAPTIMPEQCRPALAV
jgi:excisionase family DNA binding protein